MDYCLAASDSLEQIYCTPSTQLDLSFLLFLSFFFFTCLFIFVFKKTGFFFFKYSAGKRGLGVIRVLPTPTFLNGLGGDNSPAHANIPPSSEIFIVTSEGYLYRYETKAWQHLCYISKTLLSDFLVFILPHKKVDIILITIPHI